jgi:CSLREA domain-containing protein
MHAKTDTRWKVAFRLTTLALVLGAFDFPSCTQAAVFTVNSPADIVDANPGDGVCETAPGNGVCTLRAAVMESNAFTGVDTINLQSNVTYLLTHSPGSTLIIADSVNIAGAGAASTIIDGNNSVLSAQIFLIQHCLGGGACDAQHPANVAHISDLTIQHGGLTSVGGGIENDGTLQLDRCKLTQNRTFKYGAAIENGGTLTISDSTISENDTGASPGGGGGISNNGSMTLINSTVSANTAVTGGGIQTTGTLVLINSTVSGNHSSGNGGGIDSGGVTSLFSSTVAFNQANADSAGTAVGGGVASATNSTLNFVNSIIAMNQCIVTGPFPLAASDDCSGMITSQGHNIINYADPGHCTVAGTVVVGDPLLGALQDNGGPTFTHAVAVASPAIDAGNTGGCTDNFGAILSTDQRGVHRPSGAYCDIGAYESTETIFANGFEP